MGKDKGHQAGSSCYVAVGKTVNNLGQCRAQGKGGVMLTEIEKKIRKEVYKALDGIGATSHLLSIMGSWGDTLEDEEVLEEIVAYNRGEQPKIIAESDDVILFDAEQKAKQNPAKPNREG